MGPSSNTPEIGRDADTAGWPSIIAARCPPADQPLTTMRPVMPCAGPCRPSQSSAAVICATICVSVASGASV